MENDNVYTLPSGSPVHLRFKIQHSHIPKDTDLDTAIALLVKQAVFSEIQIAKSNGRELEFKPAIFNKKKKHTEIAIEGTIGRFINE